MTYTLDLTQAVGLVRLLVPDRITPGQVFEDEELTAFLAMEGGVVKLASALALEVIASDQVMVLKVIRLLDLSTDGARVSDALLKRAQALREQVNAEGVDFDVAEMVTNDFGRRELLWRQLLRSSP